MRGDLDNIVLKALRKEPDRRYATVAQFSDDLRRHLAGRVFSVIVHGDTEGAGMLRGALSDWLQDIGQSIPCGNLAVGPTTRGLPRDILATESSLGSR